jgi:GNAT superfamily N-acetyltransferase
MAVPELTEFEPASASANEWAAYHAFRRHRHSEEYPEDPFTPDDVIERRLRRPDPYTAQHLALVHRGDLVVGEAWAAPMTPASSAYESNRHLLPAGGWVLSAERREGIGRRLVAGLLALMERHGATVLSADVSQESGHAFLRRLGAEPRYSAVHSHLDLRQVDWEVVARWVREGQERSPDTRLERYVDRLPEDRHEEFARAMTELLNTMPFEALDHGEELETPEMLRDWYAREAADSVHHVYMSRESDGSISGMTDIVKHAYEVGYVRQEFTGVHPSARGRGLGKWLKAAMLEHVRAAHPDTVYLTTENAGSNASMLAINRALGFERYRTVTTYQVPKDVLARRSIGGTRGNGNRVLGRDP